jgi:hypothetical protein
MTTKSTFAPSPLSGIRKKNSDVDSDVMGVIGALESICELESRLRMAIKQTHPLDSTHDFEAADRERKALLNIRYVYVDREWIGNPAWPTQDRTETSSHVFKFSSPPQPAAGVLGGQTEGA